MMSKTRFLDNSLLTLNPMEPSSERTMSLNIALTLETTSGSLNSRPISGLKPAIVDLRLLDL